MNLESTGESALHWNVLATLLALLGAAGSLWLSVGMNLKACPLCLYQRTFLMSAAAVLLLGLATELRRSSLLPLLALPALVGGFGVAGFHEFLELSGTLECPAGLYGWGTAPQQSLAVFVAVSAVVLIPLLRGRATTLVRTAGAVVLGALLAVGTIKSAPPMPPAPTKPYDQPPDICRPPYQTSESTAGGRA